MSLFKTAKRMIVVAMMLMIILLALGLAGCSAWDTTELVYELNADGTGYLVTTEGKYVGTHLEICAKYEGLPIVGIQEKAFKKCKNLESVVIQLGDAENQNFKIGAEAFQKCTALKSVTVQRTGNIEIESNAFSRCKNLTSFDIEKAAKVTLGSFSFERINALTLSVGGADIEMNGDAFFASDKEECSYSLNLTGCMGEVRGRFANLNLVNCSLGTVSGVATNLVLDNTKLLDEKMFFNAENAVFRNTVVYRNNYKETWLTIKGGIIHNLVIESIGKDSEFYQMCDEEYYPLANNITLNSSITKIPSGVFGNAPFSALEHWEEKDLTITYGAASAIFKQLPYDTLYNGNLMRGEYTLHCADGQPATITFVDDKGNTVATATATIGGALDYEGYAPPNTTLVPGEIIKGYWTDVERTEVWVIDAPVAGDMTVYVSYVDRALLQKATIQRTSDGLVFVPENNVTFTYAVSKNYPVTLQEIKASFVPNEFATLQFFGDLEGTVPAPNLINELGTHYVYAHVTSWDKSVTNVFVLKIIIKDIYEITFVSDDSRYKDVNCTEGSALWFPNDPVKKGHTFLGWSTDGTEAGIVSKTNYVPTGSHTLTAVFKQDIYTLKIEGTTLEYQITWGESITLPVPEARDHYLFVGYEHDGELVASYNGGEGCAIRYSFEQGVTLKAKYEPIRYGITLLGGNFDMIYFTIEDDDVVLPTPGRDWYTFVGWFTEENGAGEQVRVIETSAPRSYSFYAHFELATYTVTFMDGNTVVGTESFDYNNQTIVPPAIVQKDGYTSRWESFTVSAQNFTVSVSRMPIVYTITYMNTQGCLNMNPCGYTIEEAIVFAELVKEHYEFVGWQDAHGNIITGIPKGTFGDITVTAQWDVARYTVYMYTDGDNYISQKVEYNTQFNLDAVEPPTAIDKLFVGWYNEDYTEQITGKITVTRNISVFAKWLESTSISTPEDFEKLRENPSGTFHLTCDVDMRGELISSINDFSGVLDGRGFKLYNFTLKINATLSCFGLFNTNRGTIRNLTLDEVICSVTADGTEAAIGVLVGKNAGMVSNCHVTSPNFTVNSSRHVNVGFEEGTTVYPFHIGGLVGKNESTVIGCSASIILTARFDPSVSAPGHWAWTHEMRPFIGGLVGTNSGTISDSSATSTIQCTGRGNEMGNVTCARNSFYVGGLVGGNSAGFTVEGCFANANITVKTEARSDQTTEGKIYVGAFVGTNSGIIKENYATGSIDAYAFTTGYVGGFVGIDGAGSNVSNCYTTATVTVTKATHIGGFIGALAGTVQNCYATGGVLAEAGSNAAGFVGVVTSSGVANKCFTTSNVEAKTSNAGFFSANTSGATGIITNCYYAASATVLQNGTALVRAEENGAKRDYLSSIIDPTFLQGKMYFYPDYWIFTTGTPILKWEIQTDGTSLTNGSYYTCVGCEREFVKSTSTTQATFYFDQAATCNTDGFRYFGCTVCGKHFAIITQEAIGHSYSDDSAGKDFCNNDVLVAYTCTNSGCRHTYTKQFVATGHQHNHTDSCLGCGYVYIAPSCNAEGSLTFLCDDCGNEIKKVLPAEHLWEFASFDTAPSCTVDGYGNFVCTRCLQNGITTTKKSYVVKSKLGHMDLTGDGLCDRETCGQLIYDATDATPISTVEELLAIHKDIGSGSLLKTYILTADIDLKDVAWEPIGTRDNPFNGVFLGGGFKIKNVPLFASDVTLAYGGLFGYNSGVISDLTVQYDAYSANCTNRSITFGGIAAFNNGTINQCTVAGSISLEFIARAEVNENGASASAAQKVTLGLVAGVNDGFIVGCETSANYTFTFESYAFMGEEIDHFEAGLLTSGAYQNMHVKTTQTVVAGAICGINNMSVSDSVISGTGTVYNRLALSLFMLGQWGYLEASSGQSFGTVAGNQSLVGVQHNTHTGTLTYANAAGTHAPTHGNDPGNRYYSMSCQTTIAIYN